MLITGDLSHRLQQYLHLAGQPRVGMSMMWKGFFIIQFYPPSWYNCFLWRIKMKNGDNHVFFHYKKRG